MIMAFLEDVNIEGRCTVKTPLFKGANFSHWKNAMKIFIESTDMELWEIVNNEPYVIPKVKTDKENKLINRKMNTLLSIRINLLRIQELNTFFIVV